MLRFRRIIRRIVSALNFFRPIHLPSRDSFVAHLTWYKCALVTATLFLENRGEKKCGGATFSGKTESGRNITWEYVWEDIWLKNQPWLDKGMNLIILADTRSATRVRAEEELARINAEVIDSGRGAASLTTAIIGFEGTRSTPVTDHVVPGW